MFKIQETGRPETAIWLIKENTIISNDRNGDLYFDATSSDIARVKIQVDDERIYLADLTFNQPIFINDQPIPAGSKRSLKHADQIQIGKTLFEIVNPKHVVANLDSTHKKSDETDKKHWKLKAVGNWLDGQVFILKNKTVLGRDKSCDITIPGSHLSRRHVEFVVVGEAMYMKDLDSANGCFVNNQRCREAKLQDGDNIQLDVLKFKVVAPSKLAVKDSPRGHSSAPDDNRLQEVSKNWITKPTSIGNRENDMLDVILAKHQRTKRIIYTVFGMIAVLSALITWLLLNR